MRLFGGGVHFKVGVDRIAMKSPLAVFALLQVMDLATTLVALAMGGGEQNPLVSHFMALGPVRGLILAKLLVLAVAATGALLHKDRGLRWANVGFSAVIAWNIAVIARLAFLA